VRRSLCVSLNHTSTNASSHQSTQWLIDNNRDTGTQNWRHHQKQRCVHQSDRETDRQTDCTRHRDMSSRATVSDIEWCSVETGARWRCRRWSCRMLHQSHVLRAKWSGEMLVNNLRWTRLCRTNINTTFAPVITGKPSIYHYTTTKINSFYNPVTNQPPNANSAFHPSGVGK